MAEKTEGTGAGAKKQPAPKAKKKKQRQEFPGVTDEQLREFVLAYADGRIFTSADIPKGQEARLYPLIFMPVALGAFSNVRKNDLKHVGVLWEYMNKAGPRGINGYPMFMSLRVLNRTDWDRARKAIAAELERRKDIHV
jgi:hypothetical protein